MAEEQQQPLFGQQVVSPEQLKYRRALAAELMKQGMSGEPIRSPWQGVGRIVQSLVGGYMANKEDQGEREARENQYKALRSVAEKAGYTGAQADLIAATASANFPPQANILHGVAGTAMPQYSNISTPGATVPTALPPLMGGGGAAMPPAAPASAPRAGGPATPPAAPPYRTTDMEITPRSGPGAGPAGSSITPRTEADLRRAGELGREQTTALLVRKANEDAWKEDIARMTAAPTERQQLRLMRDTIASFDPTRGNAGPIMNTIKQTVNGLVGANVIGETAPAEFLGKLNGVLSREIANKGRGGTDFSLSSAQAELPGGLQGSKEGSLKLVDHLIQMRNQDERLGQNFIGAMKSDPDNYIANRNAWLGNPKNALTSPLTGRSAAEPAKPTGPNLRGPPSKGWSGVVSE